MWINYSRIFILNSFLFILILSTLTAINYFFSNGLLNFRKSSTISNYIPTLPSNNNNASAPTSKTEDNIRILLGISTVAEQYQRRNFLRLVYNPQSATGATIEVKFVFCNLTTNDQKILVALEIMRYNDIIILNCKENMNNGKTYTYFSSLPEMFNDSTMPYPPYHYVVKADDDTYFRLEPLVESLRELPRNDLYYGYVIPCSSMNPFERYMSGMGFLVSWDIVEWIKDSEIPKGHLEGPEDRVFGDWLHYGGRGKNRFNAKWSMYNYPEPSSSCTHDLWPETIAVHLLKTREKWIKTLTYFNVTKNVKPSKLYHIDIDN